MANKNSGYTDDFGEDTVTLSLDDGQEVECGIIGIFPAAGRNYIALLPLNDKEAEEGEVYLYRYLEDENGEPSLENIEDDEEYEIVADAFDELIDEEEFEEFEEINDVDDLDENE